MQNGALKIKESGPDPQTESLKLKNILIFLCFPDFFQLNVCTMQGRKLGFGLSVFLLQNIRLFYTVNYVEREKNIVWAFKSILYNQQQLHAFFVK